MKDIEKEYFLHPNLFGKYLSIFKWLKHIDMECIACLLCRGLKPERDENWRVVQHCRFGTIAEGLDHSMTQKILEDAAFVWAHSFMAFLTIWLWVICFPLRNHRHFPNVVSQHFQKFDPQPCPVSPGVPVVQYVGRRPGVSFSCHVLQLGAKNQRGLQYACFFLQLLGRVICFHGKGAFAVDTVDLTSIGSFLAHDLRQLGVPQLPATWRCKTSSPRTVWRKHPWKQWMLSLGRWRELMNQATNVLQLKHKSLLAHGEHHSIFRFNKSKPTKIFQF